MTSRLREARRRGDRGAALLETLLVFPVAMAIFLGIFEFGLIYRDVLTTNDAVGTGARAGAVVGPRVTASGSNADYVIMRSVRESLGSIPTEWIDHIVVFKSNPPGAGGPLAQVPASCRAGTPVAGRCNVYDPQDAFLAVQSGNAAYFDCPGSGPACSWPPQSRENGPTINDIEYLGVYIRLERPYISGLFGDMFTIEQAAVVRLEPGVIE
jgi:hypothetical protein